MDKNEVKRITEVLVVNFSYPIKISCIITTNISHPVRILDHSEEGGERCHHSVLKSMTPFGLP